MPLTKTDRIIFDPNNNAHKVAYKVFLNTGTWTLNFECEKPYLSVVATIQHKLIMHALRDVESFASEISEHIIRDHNQRRLPEVVVGGCVISIFE